MQVLRLPHRSRRFLLLAPLTLALALAGSTGRLSGSAAAQLPPRLTDQEFWALSEAISEPDGTFQSDNLLSNELVFARLLPDLVAKTKPGGVYLGVGPEQNFTYIAAMRPQVAFITDIRRGNLHLQLMYKALFELSADRAEFVSRLFTKKRPDGLTTSTSVTDLMTAYWDLPSSDATTYNANLKAIQNHLTKAHTFPLSPDDLAGIARVYGAFYYYGPRMTYTASTLLLAPADGRGMTYWDLVTQADVNGQGLSYLGSEEKFAFLQDLERKNLVIPAVGDFSGPKALRAVGAYVREHNATVSAFYVSNVEFYLRRDGSWPAFCANVATMPLDEASVFIRPSGLRLVNGQPGPVTTFYFNSITATRVAGNAGTPVITTINPGPASFAGAGLVPMAAEVKTCGG